MFAGTFSQRTQNIISADSEMSLTYIEIEEYVLSLQTFLKPHELIFIIGKNDFPTIVAYLGSIRNKTVVLLLSDTINDKFLDSLIKIYKPRYVFGNKYLYSQIISRFQNIHEIMDYTLIETPDINELPKELSLLLLTSGSTGSPKLVKISEKNLESNTTSIIKSLKIDSNDCLITTLPINYSYGLSLINTHLHVGCPIILNNFSISEMKFWEIVIKFKGSSMGGVPYTYEMFSRFSREFLEKTNLRKLTQAGGKMNPSTVLKVFNLINSLGGSLTLMYGQTEATARISTLDSKLTHKYPGSIGRPIQGGKILILSSSGEPVTQPNTPGELVYYGPNVALGYAEKYQDLYLEDQNKGELRTGDIACFDENGLYYILGRTNRFIKIYGVRTSLDDIERILEDQGFECKCIQIDDVLFVFCTSNLAKDLIVKFIDNKRKIFGSNVKVAKIEDFPKNENSKISYKTLEQVALNLMK